MPDRRRVQFWFYCPSPERSNVKCQEFLHVFPVEDEPCHCGEWAWDAATKHGKDRSESWIAQHLISLLRR